MGYAEAIEQQMALLAFYQGSQGDKYIASQIAKNSTDADVRELVDAATLKRMNVQLFACAETFYVAPHIVSAVIGAAKTLPQSSFRVTDFPTRSGFAYLDGGELGIDAIAWQYSDEQFAYHQFDVELLQSTRERFRLQREIREIQARQVELGQEVTPFDLDPVEPFEGVLHVYFLMHTKTYGPGMNIWQLNHLYQGQDWAYVRDGYDKADADLIAKCQVFLAALCAFVNQRVLVATDRRVLNRTARKRLARIVQHDPVVKVVELRRREYQQRDESHEAHIEYSCQWLVRGHWRQQYFPASGEHRPLWIAPHIKGPSDKPLKPPTITAYEVVR